MKVRSYNTNYGAHEQSIFTLRSCHIGKLKVRQVVFSDYYEWVAAHYFEGFNSFYLYNETAFIILKSSVENTSDIDISTCVMIKAAQ